jgi:alpha-D-ribose 1-methylphosphonate 5-triphosphate synthase subunit PhnG
MDKNSDFGHGPRAEAMRLFALAPWASLDEKTRDLAHIEHSMMRGPEVGLVMLRGRMGATGNAFNLGETTVTRCTVKLASGKEGHAYVQGRNGEHAKRAALCDALFQEQPELLRPVLVALDAEIMSARLASSSKAAATKVDFFTMVRGDD